MAPLTDLTYNQLNDAFSDTQPLFLMGLDDDRNDVVMLNVSLLNEGIEGLGDSGVVKLMVKLRELCYAAQLTANEFQTAGERLDAFAPSAVSGGLINGGIVQTGTIKSRILTSSASLIEGATI